MSESTYDEIPYESESIPQAHPDRLCSVGRIFGMTPASVTTCRVLELGCAEGGNLVPMAASLPGSEFVGIDLSERQIRDGGLVVDALELSNVRLVAGSIEMIDATWGKFDYILCHGVYSWVPDSIRDAVLRVCRENLEPHGIAYVSYNTYPGWHGRKLAQGMMRYHAASFDDPRKQIEQSRALIRLLADRLPEGSTQRSLLERETGILDAAGDAYLYHEHLEPVNEPCYFHEFASKSLEAGLQYLGDTELATMASANLPPALGELVDHLSSDILSQEQYLDFVRDRTFRCTLLCHEDVALDREPGSDVLEGFVIRSSVTKGGSKIDLEPGRAESFGSDEGSAFEVSFPLSKAAFGVLGDRFPASLSSSALQEEAERSLRDADPGTNVGSAEYEELRDDLLRAAFAATVELRTWQPRVATEISTRPRASRVARMQVALGRRSATNAYHQAISLDPKMLDLIPRLDGSVTADDLVGLEDTLEELARSALLEA
jgi:methyltransferase-like protein